MKIVMFLNKFTKIASSTIIKFKVVNMVLCTKTHSCLKVTLIEIEFQYYCTQRITVNIIKLHTLHYLTINLIQHFILYVFLYKNGKYSLSRAHLWDKTYWKLVSNIKLQHFCSFPIKRCIVYGFLLLLCLVGIERFPFVDRTMILFKIDYKFTVAFK